MSPLTAATWRPRSDWWRRSSSKSGRRSTRPTRAVTTCAASSNTVDSGRRVAVPKLARTARFLRDAERPTATGGGGMKLRLSILAALCAVIGAVLAAHVGAAAARADDSPTTYYFSLGDSLAAGTNATGVGVAYTDLGYADQLYSALAADEPKLKLVKLGCPGESTTSM